ncbi:MAG TPA: hypothetical protein PKD95_02715 [Candidatus Paceibacterota bacterium]|nr:hypothetical protein [Candidatus Paceibacterota bacterium]
MGLTIEKKVIFALSLAFIAMTLLYFQSLATIEKMYTDSALKSLESGFASSTLVVPDDVVIEVPIEETVPLPPINPPKLPEEPIVIVPEEPDMNCYIGGCSGQLCGDASIKDVATTCEWREEYACYGPPVSACERQVTGQCGWTQTEELKQCLVDAESTQEREEATPVVI